MLLVSELLSKPVISLTEAKYVGIVKNVYFDEQLNSAKLLEIYCEDENDCETKFVLLSSIHAVGNLIVVKNLLSILNTLDPTPFLPSPLNALVCSVRGADLGRVCDIALDEKNYAIKSLFTSMGAEFSRKEIARASRSIVVIQDPLSPIRLVKPSINKCDNRVVRAQKNKKGKQKPPFDDEIELINSNIIQNEQAQSNNAQGANEGAAAVDEKSNYLIKRADNDIDSQTQGKNERDQAQNQAPKPPLIKIRLVDEGIQKRQDEERAVNEIVANENQGILRFKPLGKAKKDGGFFDYTRYSAVIDESGNSASLVRIPSFNVEVSRSPQRAPSSNGYSFLMGRYVKQDVVDQNGAIVIKQGTLIDLDVIERAKQSGRIVQLALSS